MAAVQSGRSLTVPGRGTMQFPVIDAVAGAEFVTEPLRHRIRGGTLFSSYFIDIATLDPTTLPFAVDSTFSSTVASYFANQDPAGLETWMRNDPGRMVEDDLPQVTVPILFNQAWHDAICGPGPILDAIGQIPATTPVRVMLSTLGHSVPANDYELELERELTIRWFDRFLWGEQNGVDLEAPFVVANMPLDPVEFVDASHPWEHVFESTWPSAQTSSLRLYGHDDGTLEESEPAVAGSPSHVLTTTSRAASPPRTTCRIRACGRSARSSIASRCRR